MAEAGRDTSASDSTATTRLPRLQYKSTLNLISDQAEINTEEKACFFEDGHRRIDFILVYEKEEAHHGKEEEERKKERIREFFQRSLTTLGLELETDVQQKEKKEESIVFIKVHAPFKLLCRKAEKSKLKMPLRVKDSYATVQDEYEMDGGGKGPGKEQPEEVRRVTTAEKVRKRAEIIKNLQERPKRPPNPVYRHPHHVTAPFHYNKLEVFDIGSDQDDFFSPAQRCYMVWEALQTAPNDPDDQRKRGIELLLEQKIFESAFPIHDCDLSPGPLDLQKTHKLKQDRQVLYKTWANWRCTFKPQPIYLIRRYFGEKLAFYFSFLGFYTKMLIWPSIFSLCAFVYGFAYTGDDDIVSDVCDETTSPGNWTACPICKPPDCEFEHLADNCGPTQWTYRMDNESTLVMCVLIVIWSTIFLKSWKRREAELAYEWDTYDLSSKEANMSVRPAYEQRAPAIRANAITGEVERYVPPRLKILWMTASTCVTLFMLCAVVAALTSLVVGRIALYKAFKNWGVHANVEVSRWFVHGCIFIVVFVFDMVYGWMAKKLTDLECPRTDDEWLSSFLWKVFLFELLNDFVPIGYAAWVKGNTVNTPLDLSWNSELCEPSGCLGEVTELVAVLLLARMVVGNMSEIGFPALKRLLDRCCSGRNKDGVKESRWESDFKLEEAELDGVAEEYMEMMVQFAFVTLFTPALPMAPFVCLLNNILEIRVDAINFVVSCRRPLPVRAPGIEVWNDFLNIISKAAIIINAALISFTSDIIPRLYFKYSVSQNPETKDNYIGFHTFVLSKIPTAGWGEEEESEHEHGTVARDESHGHGHVTETVLEGQHESSVHESLVHETGLHEQHVSAEEHGHVCYYRGFRSPEAPYDLSPDWWQVTCIRLVAFSLFVLLGFTFQFLYGFIVPDVPKNVQLQMQRRRHIVQQTMENNHTLTIAIVEQQAVAMANITRETKSAKRKKLDNKINPTNTIFEETIMGSSSTNTASASRDLDVLSLDGTPAGRLPDVDTVDENSANTRQRIKAF